MPESYTHLFAKRLLAEWLRNRACPVKVYSDDDYCIIALEPIRALVPARDPLKGVYEEYPVCLTEPRSTTLHHPWIDGKIPTYDELISLDRCPDYILDIAVMHMGQIKYGLEIVHSHDVSGAKIEGLHIATRDIPFELYKVRAEWVLNHCQPPTSLKLERLTPAPYRRLSFTTTSSQPSYIKNAVPRERNILSS